MNEEPIERDLTYGAGHATSAVMRSPRRLPRRFANLRAAAGGLLVCLLTFVLAGSQLMVLAFPARAATCTGGGFGWGSKPDNNNHFGTGATMSLISVNPVGECTLVRSAYINLDSQNEAEVGWHQNGFDDGGTICNFIYSPHVLVWAITNGTKLCLNNTPDVTQTQRYWLQNLNHDRHIQYFWDGNGTQQLANWALDFGTGLSWAFDEIHGSDGGSNLRAHFWSLQRMGQGGIWTDWTNLNWWGEGDTSGSHICPYSNTEWAARITSNPC